MKLINLFSSLVLANCSLALAGEPVISESFEAIQSEIPGIPQVPFYKNYVKMGANLAIYDFSIGYREINEAHTRAIDHSFNFHSLGLVFGGILSYKYSQLYYKQPSSRHFKGIGWELGCAFFPEMGVFPYPGIDLIYGKEFGEKNTLKWVQTEIRLLPIVLAGIAAMDYSPNSRYHELDLALIGLFALSAVSVSFAF